MVETFIELLMCEQPGRYRDAEMAASYAVPRGHGKTTSIVSLLIQVLCTWDQIPDDTGADAVSCYTLFDTFDRPYVYLFGKKAGQAESNLRKIKHELETNELLRRDFGIQVGPVWRNNFIKLRNGAVVAAAGVGQAIRGALEDGQRPNVLVFDDVDDEQNLITEEARQKTEDWLDKVALALGIPGESVAFFFGTIIHTNSLLAKLTNRDDRPGWGGRVYSALTKGSNPREPGCAALWPAKMPVSKLRKAYNRTSPKGWASEYMNNPVDDATSLFPMKWLNAALKAGSMYSMLERPPPRDDAGNWAQFEVVAQAFDLAFVDDPKRAEIQKSCWNVCVTFGLDWHGNVHVIHLDRCRGLNPTEIDTWIMMCAYTHEPDVQIIERNHAGHCHIHTIVQETDIHVIAHDTGKNKHHNVEGIPGLQRPFEDGKVLIYCGDPKSRKLATQLVTELHHYPAKPDDSVLAFWVGWFRLRRIFKRLGRLKEAAEKRAKLQEQIQRLKYEARKAA